MPNYYDILGVSRSATTDEIKAAYRKMCMQTHPDVAGKQRTSIDNNADKFKRISEAYSILGNAKERKLYDYETFSEAGIRERVIRNRNAAAASAGRGGEMSPGFMLPRNVLIGGILGIVGVTLFRTILPSNEEEESYDGKVAKKTGHTKLVNAWKNPSTGRWETPKPWDPMYQKLQPTLQLVPRKEVDGGNDYKK